MKPTSCLFLIACTLLAGSPAQGAAPSAANASPPTETGASRTDVLSVVQAFFDAMAARDPVACRRTLLADGQLCAVSEPPKSGGPSRRTLGEFADGVSTWKQRPLERIWNPTVLVHGRVATISAPYDFHRDGKFSHSGLDLFTLVQTDDGWKIASLVFTVEPHTPSQHPDGPPKVTARK